MPCGSMVGSRVAPIQRPPKSRSVLFWTAIPCACRATCTLLVCVNGKSDSVQRDKNRLHDKRSADCVLLFVRLLVGTQAASTWHVPGGICRLRNSGQDLRCLVFGKRPCSGEAHHNASMLFTPPDPTESLKAWALHPWVCVPILPQHPYARPGAARQTSEGGATRHAVE